jgi:hypothetical protein
MDLFDVYQQRQISRVQRQFGSEAANNQQQRARARDEIEELHGRIDRLTMVNEAMWELLCECTGLTEEHLAHRMQGLDMADGQSDGRRQVQALECSCGARVNARAAICHYCGLDAPKRSTFDRL